VVQTEVIKFKQRERRSPLAEALSVLFSNAKPRETEVLQRINCTYYNQDNQNVGRLAIARDRSKWSRKEKRGGDYTLWNMLIQEQHRRKGYGALFVKEIFEICRGHHINRLYLVTSMKNEAAVKLYQKCGFSIFDHDPEDENHIEMRILL
jgi:GNAT superfamily N-acetyltransferase